MQVFKNNVSLEATPTGDTHVTNKGYVDGTVESLLDDTSTRSDRTWSSEKISKINVTDAKKVDSKPTYSAGTITYTKDGASYTTTNNKQWFYYLENEVLKQTIFIDGEELTIDGASVDFDDFVAKTDIATTLDDTVTDEQVVGALTIYNAIKDWDFAYNFDYVDNTSLNVNLAKAGLYKFSTITEGAPSDNPGDYTLLNIPWKKNQTTLRYGTQLLFSPRVQHFYFRRVWNYKPETYVYTEGDYSVFGKWKRVCTTSNDDMSCKTINTFEDASLSGNVRYEIKNGICYVSFNDLKCTSTSAVKLMDCPKNYGCYKAAPIINNSTFETCGKFSVSTTDSTIYLITKENVNTLCGYLSYPIADDWQP